MRLWVLWLWRYLNNDNGSSNLPVNWHPFLGPIQRDWSEEYWGNGDHLLPCLPTWLSLWSHLLYFTLFDMSLLYFPFFSPICSRTENLNLLSFEQGGWWGRGEKTTANPSILKFALGVERVMAGFFSSWKLRNKKVFLIQNTEFQVIMAFTNTFIFLYVVLIYFQLNILTTLNLYYD